MKATAALSLLLMLGPCLSLLSLVSKKSPSRDRKLDIDDIQNDPIVFNMENFRLKLEGIDRQLETYQDMMRKGKADNFEMMDKALTMISQKANMTPTDLFLKKHFDAQNAAEEEADEEERKKI